jgi:glycosyltransferase involved in cell wall biosynthesis
MEIGGSQKIILDLIERLSDRFEHRILTGLVPTYVTYEGYPLSVANTQPAISRLLEQFQPDVVHMHYWGMDDWMSQAVAEVKRFKRDRGTFFIQNSNNPIQVYFDEAIDSYVHVSRFVSQIQEKPIPEEKNTVIYPGVDPSEFGFCENRSDYRSIGMVYRLTDDKISRHTIEILIELVKRLPDRIVTIIGDGPNLAHFMRRTREANVRANFHFTGFVRYDQLSSLYEKFDVFLAPVYHESYGVVTPYAMFKGNPVVSYRTDAMPELLGDDSFLVERDNINQIVECLKRLEDPETRQAAVRQNLDRAMKLFSLDSMLESYSRLYGKCL